MEDIFLKHDNLINDIDSMIQDLSIKIAEGDIKNREYNHWNDEYNRMSVLSMEAEDELSLYITSLKLLEDKYEDFKLVLVSNLEETLTDTLNSWYVGSGYDLRFTPVTKGRKVYHELLDINIGSDLLTICGGSASQTSGTLVLNAILKTRGSNFLFLDEAFSNMDRETSIEMANLLTNGLDIQIVLIENKEPILENLTGLTHNLLFDNYETKVISTDDPHNEVNSILNFIYGNPTDYYDEIENTTQTDNNE